MLRVPKYDARFALIVRVDAVESENERPRSENVHRTQGWRVGRQQLEFVLFLEMEVMLATMKCV